MSSALQTLLILGGARSGKSTHALSVAEACAAQPVFIATAAALDDEMAARIARHIAERGDDWRTEETPLALVDALQRNCDSNHVVVVDCLTLWLSNIMHSELDVEREIAALSECVASIKTALILVSNEVGMGIVPDSELARRFRDAQGQLNRAIAAACTRVELVAAGLPLRLKG